MLKRYAAAFSLLRSVLDILIIAAAWLCAYYIRFYLGVVPIHKGIPPFSKHLHLTLPVICICYLGCVLAGLYRSKRVFGLFRQFTQILKASIVSGLLLLAFLYYTEEVFYSRALVGLFVLMLFAGLSVSHLLVMALLRFLRKKGYNLRHYAVIGAGKKGQTLVRDIEKMAWLGLKCAFFVDDNPSRIGKQISGVPVFGPVEKLPEMVDRHGVDEVYLALGGDQARRAYPILESIQRKGTTVRIIPDWGGLTSMSATTAVVIGSQVLFSAADTPLSGANIILKEVFDRVVALVLLLVLALPFAVIALLIKLTSKGPIFYRQTRIGLDGRRFRIIKFRTMHVDAQNDERPGWTRPDDPRCTTVGRWLRRLSLDELPQLINVVKGEMSLVGPRPEQPQFVEQFAEEYGKYMFRHKLKAGMTGWAQVHGYRGDTSLKKRLQYDLYYIRNWSFSLDIWTLLLTPWHVLKRKNAY